MSRSLEPDRHRQAHPQQTPVARGSRAVVGFDATDASQDALAYAIGWAYRVHGHLDVLHVPENRQDWIVGAYAATCSIGAVPDGSDLSGVVADLLAGTGVSWSYHTASGGIVRALQEHVDRIGADVIIIGRPRRRLSVMRASIAHRLLNNTDRIVIVVP